MRDSEVVQAEEACAAADQRVAECKAALEQAEESAAACRSRLQKLLQQPPPPPAAPAEGLKGAFNRGPLKETKAERRESMEIAEMQAMADAPAWVSPTLLDELRQRATETCAVADAPIDVMRCIARAKQVACLRRAGEPDDPNDAGSEWWAVLAAADLLPTNREGAGSPDDEVLVCLGQDGNGRLRGAIGWWPQRALSGAAKAGRAVAAEGASRCVALEEEEEEDGGGGGGEKKVGGALWVQHVTVQGLGEGGAAPVPAQLNLHAPVACQLAETMRETLLSQRQISARLQRGGAAEAERKHVKRLLGIGLTRLQACAAEASASGALPVAELNKCEAAVQGLRKALLFRSVAVPGWPHPPCVSCGVRHSDVEIHTCKFWREWASENAPGDGAAAAER